MSTAGKPTAFSVGAGLAPGRYSPPSDANSAGPAGRRTTSGRESNAAGREPPPPGGARGGGMRKIILGCVAATLGVSTALAAGAFADGNGAQRSGLSPQSGNNNNQCVAGSGAGTNGFVIINAPGQPGHARFVNGE